jgi:hypothetical protein
MAVLSDEVGRLNPVVEWQRHVETRDRVLRVQRKIGAASIFGKRPTRKGVNPVFELCIPQAKKDVLWAIIFWDLVGRGNLNQYSICMTFMKILWFKKLMEYLLEYRLIKLLNSSF